MAVEQFIDAERVERDIAINTLDLRDEFSKQAGRVYYYTTLAAKADRQVADLKLKLEANEALVAKEVRDGFTNAEPPVKPTVAMIEEAVRRHPKTLRLDMDINQAKEVADVLKGVVQAMRDRKDMLVSLGLMDRDERNAKITMMERGPGERQSPQTSVSERMRMASR